MMFIRQTAWCSFGKLEARTKLLPIEVIDMSLSKDMCLANKIIKGKEIFFKRRKNTSRFQAYIGKQVSRTKKRRPGARRVDLKERKEHSAKLTSLIQESAVGQIQSRLIGREDDRLKARRLALT
jgi:hypothetical protein